MLWFKTDAMFVVGMSAFWLCLQGNVTPGNLHSISGPARISAMVRYVSGTIRSYIEDNQSVG